MKTQLQFLGIALLAFFLNVNAQKEAQKWYFGTNAGLDFSTNPPTALSNGAMSVPEGCASICDADGNLLFYTSGTVIFDSTHAVMATGLTGGNQATQPAMIVQQPGNPKLYYVFTVPNTGSSALGLRYSIVDMTLSSGLGSVTALNAQVYAPCAEKLTAVRHCNGTDVWILSHENGSNVFRSYLLTASGLSATPVLSAIGPIVSGIAEVGYMKVSANGRKLGMAYSSNAPPGNVFEVYDFDPSSGTVSNQLVLLTNTYCYGCEFSPDGTKFYGVRVQNSNQIYQWDLCAGSASAIIASQYTFNTIFVPFAIQLAPNGKLYITKYGQPALDVINNPNSPGAACNHSIAAQSIGSRTCTSGLPNFMGCLVKPTPPSFAYSVSGRSASFTAAPTLTSVSGCSAANYSLTSIQWQFDDPGSGAANFSNLSNPVHTFPCHGTFVVKCIYNYQCSSDTVRVKVTIADPCLGIDPQDKQAETNIFPNPVKEKLIVETNEYIRLSIYDQSGGLVEEKWLETGSHIINTNLYRPGIYTIRAASYRDVKVLKLIKLE